MRLDTLRRSFEPSWEATVVSGAWIGAYFVELFCWATVPVDSPECRYEMLVCIDILAFALFFAFELLLTVRRESGTYDKRFRSARVTYGSPWSCGSTIGPGFAQVAIYHPQQ